MIRKNLHVFRHDHDGGKLEQRRDGPKTINPRVYSFNLCLVLSGISFIDARMAIV